MKKIPDSLLDLQRKQREQTISAVKSTIQELKAEKCLITIKRLCERTGLSRSVFNKPHVKALMDEELFHIPAKAVSEGTLESQYAKLLLQLEKSRRRESDLKLANMQLRETVQELRSECELLRGELHSLMQRGMQLQRGDERK